MGKFVDADRSYVITADEKTTRASMTHEWCSEGIMPTIDRFTDIDITMLLWAASYIMRGELLCIPDASKLPKEAEAEINYFNAEGTKSVLVVPMHHEGKLVGLVGFDAVRSANEWNEDVVTLLKVMSELFVNVLARKNAEVLSRRTTDKLNSILVSSKEYAIIAMDTDFNIIEYNPAAEKIFGYKKHEIIGKNVYDIHKKHNVDKLKFERAVQEVLNIGKWDSNVVVHNRDGSLKYVRTHAVPMLDVNENRIGYVVFARDVTDQRQGMEALRESENRYRTLFEGASDAIFLYNPAGRIIDVNKQACNTYGYTRNEMLRFYAGEQLSASQLIENNNSFEIFQSALSGETKFFEWFGRKKDGSTFPEEVSLNPINIAGERYCLAIIRDVTERKKTEKILNEQRAYLRQVIDLSPNFIFAKDRQGRYTLVNKSLADAYGTTVDNLIGKCDADFNNSKEEVQQFRRDDLEVMNTKKEKFIPEEPVTESTGKVRFVQTVKRAIIDDDGNANQVLGVSADITERKKAEEEKERLNAKLYESQKMESIGLLAGGIAHDFNNLLAGIIGYASLASEELGPDHKTTNSINMIMQSADKASRLTRELLAYAEGGAQIRETFDLNKLVIDMLNILKANISSNITIEQNLSQLPVIINADYAQIQHIVMNMCINAGESIGDKLGKITITTGDVVTAGKQCSDCGDSGTQYVFLEIIDTGCGMSEEVQGRIFDPFFSTKRFGRGMGLAAVQGIISRHNGHIKIDSSIDTGTKFTCCLPASFGVIPQKEKKVTSVNRGTETILVIDDEDSIKQVARLCLEKLGYNVLVASTGEEAINLCGNINTTIDLVILDLILPDMKGDEILSGILSKKPNVKVLASSGYSESTVLKQIKGEAVIGFIQKPYTIQELGNAVRQALDQSK